MTVLLGMPRSAEALKAMAEAYQKLGGGQTLAQAIAHVSTKTATGRALLKRSVEKSLARYYE
jgi:hypothetical protein